MLRPNRQSPFGKRSSVAIRRVLRQGDRFTCGVCRKVYGREADAETCLAQCLHAHLNPSTAIVAEVAGASKRYRCHFCKRLHDDKERAKQCAAACKAKSQAAIAAEAAVKVAAAPVSQPSPMLMPTAAPKKKRATVRVGQDHKYLRDGRKLVCRKCNAEHPNLDLVIACYDGHPAKVKGDAAVATPRPAAPARDESTSTPAVAAAPEPAPAAPAPPSDDHKFSRDGARYVCRGCKKKFFTRGDVGQCFDSHAA